MPEVEMDPYIRNAYEVEMELNKTLDQIPLSSFERVPILAALVEVYKVRALKDIEQTLLQIGTTLQTREGVGWNA